MGKKLRIISSIFTLTILLLLLLLTITIKSTTDEILKETVKNYVPEEIQEGVKETSNWLDEVLKDDTWKKELEDKTGINLEDEEIKKIFNPNKIKKEIDKSVEKESTTVKVVWQLIKILLNTNTKKILIFLILLQIIFLIFKEKSLFLWIKAFTWSSIISGSLFFLLTSWLKKTLNSFLQINTITLNPMFTYAYFLVIFGVIIRLFYSIVARIKKANTSVEKEEEDEVS